jgi:WS/DGAT/MGAT family acyltransferase
MATMDAAWLHMDGPTNRMVITGVMELDRRVDFGELLQVLEDRLVRRYPRFRQVVGHGPLGEARWAADDAFDLRSHVHRVGLPWPGGRAALQEVVGQLVSSPLDAARPLWQIHVVDGLDGGGCALVARLHHAMADGISLARVLLSLADGEHDRTEEVDVPQGVPPEEAGGGTRASLLARAERLVAPVRTALREPERVLEATTEQVVSAARLGGGSASVARKLLTMADDPPTSLRGPLGPRKVVAWHDGVPLDRVKAIARGLGGTVNDVLLTALAAALGRSLRARGDDVAEVRTFVPVNLRPADQEVPPELGNRFGLVFVALPVEHQPPRQRFDEVKRRMDAMKQSPEAVVTHAILSAVGLSPAQVERLVVEVFGAKASLITTNVPGPRDPLVLAGATVRKVLFWVPQSGAVSLGVSIFSYAGQVVWGVSADSGRWPDPGGLVDDFDAALGELEGSLA